MTEPRLCSICGYEFSAEDELEFDELDPSGRRWNEKQDDICKNCKEDLDI